jgi:hypothetical protein
MTNKDNRDLATMPVTPTTLGNLIGGPTMPERYKSVGDAIATVLVGRELGLAPMTSINELYIVGGQAGMSGKAMLALIHRAGHRCDVKISTTGAKATAYRRDPVTKELDLVGEFTFDEEDAKRAKLTEKNTYKAWPQIMYGWRAVGLAARFAYSDVLTGLLLPEEIGIEDTPIEPIEDAIQVVDLDDEVDEGLDADEVAEALDAEVADG